MLCQSRAASPRPPLVKKKQRRRVQFVAVLKRGEDQPGFSETGREQIGKIFCSMFASKNEPPKKAENTHRRNHIFRQMRRS